MPKRTKEERECIRKAVEANRDPAKDLTAHRDGRQKKLSMSDLTKVRPTEEELTEFSKFLVRETPRAAAIMCGAVVENALEDAIKARLIDPGHDTMRLWFEGPNAPFSKFSAKIALGRAIGIYGEMTEKRLSLIKAIRNAFAHRSMPLDFSEPAILSAVKELSVIERKDFWGKHAYQRVRRDLPSNSFATYLALEGSQAK